MPSLACSPGLCSPCTELRFPHLKYGVASLSHWKVEDKEALERWYKGGPWVRSKQTERSEVRRDQLGRQEDEGGHDIQ